MAEIRITGVSFAEGEGDEGAGIVARFACVIGPLRVTGCILRRDHLGRLQAIMPRCQSKSGSIRFVDRAEHPQLTEAATAAYAALGGVLPAPRDP